MTEHCPKDGGFIGEAGCTHPNHEHSELVKSMLSGETRMVSEDDATAALREGFYIKNPNGKQLGFGPSPLALIENDRAGNNGEKGFQTEQQ